MASSSSPSTRIAAAAIQAALALGLASSAFSAAAGPPDEDRVAWQDLGRALSPAAYPSAAALMPEYRTLARMRTGLRDCSRLTRRLDSRRRPLDSARGDIARLESVDCRVPDPGTSVEGCEQLVAEHIAEAEAKLRKHQPPYDAALAAYEEKHASCHRLQAEAEARKDELLDAVATGPERAAAEGPTLQDRAEAFLESRRRRERSAEDDR